MENERRTERTKEGGGEGAEEREKRGRERERETHLALRGIVIPTTDFTYFILIFLLSVKRVDRYVLLFLIKE